MVADRLVRYAVDPAELILDELVLETGRPYRESVEPWQETFFRASFATDDGYRPRHRLIYSERRRGESKTEDSAAIALADSLTGPPHHRSYAVAADEDQAKLILDSVRGFKQRSPILSGLVVNRNIVRNTATGSELRVMSSDDRTAFGIRPRRVFFDELSLQVDDGLWSAMWTAIGKRADAQLVAVSMAGFDFSSLGWRVRELARTTPGYYFHSREGSDLAPWLSVENLEEQRATLHPADFARFWECRWTEPLGAWVTREMYEAAEVGQEAHGGSPGYRYAGFVDVGLVHDATAVAVCHLEGDRVVLDTLRTLQGTRSAPVELAVLESLVEELTALYGVRGWVFEAPQAVASVQRLQERLSAVASVSARYPTVETQARLFGTLYRLFSASRLVLYPHDQLKREALNLVVKAVGGRLKVVESTSVHQDHVIALGGAADLLVGDELRIRPWTATAPSIDVIRTATPEQWPVVADGRPAHRTGADPWAGWR